MVSFMLQSKISEVYPPMFTFCQVYWERERRRKKKKKKKKKPTYKLYVQKMLETLCF
jgi:hypothetical protein